MSLIIPLLKSFFDFITKPDNQRYVLFILVVILGLGIAKYRGAYLDEQSISKNRLENVNALRDSVRTYETTTGELGFERQALVSDKKSLKVYSDSLFAELEKERGNVKTIIKTSVVVKSDTVYLSQTSVTQINDAFTVNFQSSLNRDSTYFFIKGYVEFRWDSLLYTPYNISTRITDNVIKLSLITGIREYDDIYTIFVRSPLDNVQITNLQGAVIQKSRIHPKSRRFGFGVSSGMQFNGANFLPYIGVGFNYNLIKF